jgi:hypothetical protein
MALDNLLAAAQGRVKPADTPVRIQHRIKRKSGKFNQVMIVKPGPLTPDEISRIADALGLKKDPDPVRLRSWQYVKNCIAGVAKPDTDAISVRGLRLGFRFIGQRNTGVIIAALREF